MNTLEIFLLSAIGFVPYWFKSRNIRNWMVVFLSVAAIIVFQPKTSLPGLNVYIIFINFSLVFTVWKISFLPKILKEDLFVFSATSILLFIFGFTNHISPLILLLLTIVNITIVFFPIKNKYQSILLNLGIIFIISIFAILKYQPLQISAAVILRNVFGRNPSLASITDIVWLGYSYLAFRLLHVLLDSKSKRSKPSDLATFISYIFFFPTILAGPIDTLSRFAKDFSKKYISSETIFLKSLTRITTGVVFKFIFANSLNYFSLAPQNADQISQPTWMWFSLFAYSWQIFFDFAGLSHIAIGVGMLFNIKIPENFQSPYNSENITLFWNRWHITLSHWVRSYFFFPFSKTIKKLKFPNTVALLFGQIGTMVLIGLWHGFTIPFLIWGLWHGIGLFFHYQWKNLVRKNSWTSFSNINPNVGKVFTFLFVSLGWVWFLSEDLYQASSIFSTLLGLY